MVYLRTKGRSSAVNKQVALEQTSPQGPLKFDPRRGQAHHDQNRLKMVLSPRVKWLGV